MDNIANIDPEFLINNPFLKHTSDMPNFYYDNPGDKYFEILNDGTVIVLANDISSVDYGREWSVAGGYKRAKNGESRLFIAYNDMNAIHIAEIDDFKALADGFGLPYETDHVHKFSITEPEYPSTTRGQVKVGIKFSCGCSIGHCNRRGFARYFKEKHGWTLIQKSTPILRESQCDISFSTIGFNPEK